MPDEILGKTDEAVLPSDLAAACRESDDFVISRGEMLRFEEESAGPNGSTVVYETIKAPVFDAEGKVAGLVGVSRDITERKTMENALRDSEERFRTLYENSTLGLYRTTPDGRILLANPTLVRMLGYENAEEIGRRNLDEEGFEAGYSRSYFKDTLEREDEIRGLHAVWKRKNGTPIHIRESARAIRAADGAVRYYEGTVEDVSKWKKAEEERAESEALYRALFENANDAVFLLDPGGDCLKANGKAAEMTGYSREELAGLPLKALIAPSEYAEARKKLLGILGGEPSPVFERTFRRKDGVEFPAEVNASVIREADRPPRYIQGIVRDISDRRHKEQALKTALQEKELLLKEIHHRVKNNMQTVSSLLNLQSRRLSNPADAEVFREAQHRIRSMSLVHELLYQSPTLARIEMSEYLRRIASNLLPPPETAPGRIRMKLDIEEIFFNIQTAIPLGLIVNELLSNTLKHAFPGGRAGHVDLALCRRDGEGFLLSVKDDGIGLPDSFDQRAAESMGFMLVSLFVEQLNGRIEIIRRDGTEFRIFFKETGDGSIA